jgi:hypothetical protein
MWATETAASLTDLHVSHTAGFFPYMVKGPAADATDAPQPSGFLCNPLMKMRIFFYQVLQLMEHQWNEIDRENRQLGEKTCPSATLSTTNPTWTDPGSNPGFRSERPATNRLSHGTAHTAGYSLTTSYFVVPDYLNEFIDEVNIINKLFSYS